MDWNAVTFEAWDATRGAPKRRRAGDANPSCSVLGCAVDLSDAKPYFKRHCICIKMRYCQQCGHFESLDQFIGANR
ncbi:Squamosa promoter-binding protein 1 [Tetrabaena socialis]|uniref:Squamosa promoter-binding protein 1 n=1 Tax=Tetrabaena socialis TaxID=47790 RepID=A0A2J8AGT6_9CHLO|nr:Squamosa promoter-binding protein 1 [Tetrabaena socialis]|eukprot:PNH11735.1 Squamosa promoter-binding protein 1 [Tetrabaena socialis]